MVQNHSQFPAEDEVLLLPCSYFEVIDSIKQGNELRIIHIKQIEPPVTLIQPPFTTFPKKQVDPNVHSTVEAVASGLSKLKVATKSNEQNMALLSTPMRGTDAALTLRARWSQNGITVAGGNGKGGGLNQLSSPHGLYVDEDETVYVADSGNHRVVAWPADAPSGQVVAGGNKEGSGLNQLQFPSDVIVDRATNSLLICDAGNCRVVKWTRLGGTHGELVLSKIICRGLTMDDRGFLYVSDGCKREVRRFKVDGSQGTLMAGGNGQGHGLGQFNDIDFIFVDRDHSVYGSDDSGRRVMKWMEGANVGQVVAGGDGYGSDAKRLSNPNGVVVDGMGTVYVADGWNHRIVRWPRDASEGSVVVSRGDKGNTGGQLNTHVGLSFDRHGNLYVVNQADDRVEKFELLSP
ncbi:unnamed protein product [Rotaria magnacalcarata]|nr:unnamed protein product [Rotaria magnacalcarata]